MTLVTNTFVLLLGPNGSHVCQVTALQGTRFGGYGDIEYRERPILLRLRPDLAHTALRSLLKTLSHVRAAGVVHNGKET